VLAADLNEAVARSYSIPAGPLGRALSSFAASSGVPLSFDPKLTEGLSSPALDGSYTAREGFNRLLGGSGLELFRQPDGNYGLRRVPSGKGAMLPEVKVTANALTVTEGSGSYTTPAVTIGKTPLALREIPQSVSVLTRQRMDDQNMHLLETALDQMTGIQLDTTTGAVGSSNLYSRGFLVNSYQYDGVPQTFLGTSYTGFDLAVMDRVEVIRGAAGLLQGTGNPSATVNLVRKKPTRELAISGAISAGSWDNYRGELDVGGPLNETGTLRGRFVAVEEDSKSFVNTVESQKGVFYGVLEADLGPATTASLGVYQQRVNAIPSIFGLPRYSDGRSLGLDRSTVLTPSWNRWSQDIEEVFANVTHKLDNQWQVNASALYSRQMQDFKRSVTRGTDLNGGVIPGGTAGSIYTGVQWTSESDRTNFDVNASGPITLFGRKHELLFGANSLSNRLNSKQSAIFAAVPIPDVFNFDPHGVPEPVAGPYTDGSRTDTSQHGVYASGRFSITDPLKLILGARMSWYQTRTDTAKLLLDVSTAGPNVRYDREVTPYAGLVYDLNRTYSLYASYADIFTPQTTQFTSSGAILDPIVGANYEVGVKGEFLDGDVNTSLALFRVDQKNRAIEDLSNPCTAATEAGHCYVSAGKVRSQGLEAEISGRLTNNWNLFAGYTYNETEYLQDNLNEGLPFRTQTPRHLFKLWSQYRLPVDDGRWSLGGGVNAQSSYYAMSGPVRSEQDAYAIFKLSLSYQINPKTSLSLIVNNLFDKVYYSGIRGVDIGNVYGAPRNAMLTLRMRY
jgi:outer membrane receptor for ferric coprogen and ferric-rhodotorulic acid